MQAVDIILPVYNEEQGLSHFHQALGDVLDQLSDRYRFQVIYVLDRSRDNSFEVLKGLAATRPNVTIIHLARRFGHQMSLVAGLDHSLGDAVIMMDCDCQHPPAVIPLLLEKFESGYDVVHAIRTYDAATPVLKRWTSGMFYRLQNLLSPIEIPLGAADFRLISRKVATVFQEGIREQNQFLRGLFQWVGFRSAQVPFASPPRVAGRTKYRPLALLAFSIVGLTSFSKLPLRFSILAGFLLSSFSLLYGIWLLFIYFTAGHLPPGYTSLILMVLFLGGLQLTVLGILGEYVGSIFDEVKRRPLYVVDEIVDHKTAVTGQ
jgi:polyisoprenyl-phosphate glycosyltransferase